MEQLPRDAEDAEQYLANNTRPSPLKSGTTLIRPAKSSFVFCNYFAFFLCVLRVSAVKVILFFPLRPLRLCGEYSPR
jgi:uncharacterized membrane protein